MPWYKCAHCRIRRSGLDVAISAVQDDCPLCGRTLDPEHDLTLLVGYKFLAGFTTDADADAVCDALAAERWLDEGGSGEPRR